MKNRLSFIFAVLWLVMLPACAQMTFTFNGVSADNYATEVNPQDGSTTITLPSGTSLNGLITAVKVDGATVDASQVKPNPLTTTLNFDELRVFTYNNKAYGFRFTEDVWFTAVFISDCHTNQGSGHDGTSAADLTTIMNNIVNMGKDGTKKVTFEANTNYVPKTSIIFCLGDIDQDKGNSDNNNDGKHTNFLNATAEVAKTAGIPFIFIAGNHDLSPDYWTGENGDEGVTYGSTGGSNADDKTIEAITTNNNYWNSQGVFDSSIEYFTDDSKTGNSYFQSKPFTFKFKDVRFYCAQTYWFQKLYSKPGLLSSATYYAPDKVIKALSTFVDNHTKDASVWMQHYPWVAGSDCNRWWLDQNDVGRYIPTSDESAYGTNESGIAYNDAEVANTKKKDPLSAIMAKAGGKVNDVVQHFSGHYHRFADNIYTNTTASIHDYTVAAPGNSNQTNNAFVVLMKRGVGVVEVKQAQF